MKKTTVIKLAVIASTIMLLASCSLSQKEHVHTLAYVVQKDATCTENGNIAYYKCIECEAKFSDEDSNDPIEDVSIPVDPNAHSFVKVDAKPATLEAEGYETTHWKCSYCGKVYIDEEGKEETMLEAITIPKGFAKLYSGTVTTSIGTGGIGPFSQATTTPVTVDAFYMAMTETTYERWYEVYTWATSDARGVNKYTFANSGCEGNDGVAGAAPTSASKEPVTSVLWRDAVVWCNAASEMDGRTPVYYEEGTDDFTSEYVLRVSQTIEEAEVGSGKAEKAVINANADGYRLPTNAEWEYAARGGDPSAPEWKYKYAGTNSDSDMGNYAVCQSNSGSKTANVATKNANSAGLFDMCGNVWEWSQSFWQNYKTSIARGGSWYSSGTFSNVSYAAAYYLDYKSDVIGFRVAFSKF